MATKAVNFKLDETVLADIRTIAGVFRMTMTDVVNEALEAYLSNMKKDPFFRLTTLVEDASPEESEEILAEINDLTDDDLTISSSKLFVG